MVVVVVVVVVVVEAAAKCYLPATVREGVRVYMHVINHRGCVCTHAN